MFLQKGEQIKAKLVTVNTDFQKVANITIILMVLADI